MVVKQQERRRDDRVTFRATAKLSFPGNRSFDMCETKDISVSGVFVEGVSGVVFGEKCDVELHLYGRTSNLTLEMAGEAVRVLEEGVALQFFDVDDDSFYHLQNIVYFNYKHSDQPNGTFPLADDIDDSSLYLGADNSGKKAALPDNYLDDLDENDSDDFGEDDTDEYVDRISSMEDDESDY